MKTQLLETDRPKTDRPKTRRLISVLGAATVGAALLTVTAVGNDVAGATSSQQGATSSAKNAATAIPPGTVLRVGEQLKNLSSVLSLERRGQEPAVPGPVLGVRGRPPMLQAFEGGSLDVGFIQSTPLIFAQAAGQTVDAVAGWASAGKRLLPWSRRPGTTRSSRGPASRASGWRSRRGPRSRRCAARRARVRRASISRTSRRSTCRRRRSPPRCRAGRRTPVSRSSRCSAPTSQANPTRADHHPARRHVTEKADFLVATRPHSPNRAKSAAIADYITRLIKAYAVPGRTTRGRDPDGLRAASTVSRPARAAAWPDDRAD